MNQTVTFRDLFSHDPNLSPAEGQRLATEELPNRVRLSALAWGRQHPDTKDTDRWFLIGVVVWSKYDLRLLDLVNEAVARGTAPDLRVSVFDLGDLVSPAGLQRLLAPGFYEPPPICNWAPGQMKDTASGFVAELRRILPGIGEVYQSPAVGYWEAGRLKETAFGFHARQLVGRVLGFDPNLVLESPTAAAG